MAGASDWELDQPKASSARAGRRFAVGLALLPRCQCGSLRIACWISIVALGSNAMDLYPSSPSVTNNLWARRVPWPVVHLRFFFFPSVKVESVGLDFIAYASPAVWDQTSCSLSSHDWSLIALLSLIPVLSPLSRNRDEVISKAGGGARVPPGSLLFMLIPHLLAPLASVRMVLSMDEDLARENKHNKHRTQMT